MNVLNPPIIARIAIGKGIGLVFGLAGMLSAPLFYPEIDNLTRIGILLWYPTMGAFIGVFGVLIHHPVLNMPLPWWVRAPLIGAWMNFVLVFFAYDTLSAVISGTTGTDLSPFWFVLQGAIVGAVIGFLATRYAGDGPAILAS